MRILKHYPVPNTTLKKKKKEYKQENKILIFYHLNDNVEFFSVYLNLLLLLYLPCRI